MHRRKRNCGRRSESALIRRGAENWHKSANSWRPECGAIDPCQRRKPPEAVAQGQRQAAGEVPWPVVERWFGGWFGTVIVARGMSCGGCAAVGRAAALVLVSGACGGWLGDAAKLQLHPEDPLRAGPRQNAVTTRFNSFAALP